jgi:hypothetical protein
MLFGILSVAIGVVVIVAVFLIKRPPAAPPISENHRSHRPSAFSLVRYPTSL